MNKRLYFQIISLILLVGALGLWGCENRMSAPIINSGVYTPSIDDYFPLSAGRTTKIVSTNSGYEPNVVITEQFECGEGVERDNQSVFLWIRTNLAYSSVSDTSFFYLTESVLYFYETAESSPEKILEEPLEVGQTWHRFESSLAGSNNLLSYLIDSLETKIINDGNEIDENKDGLPDIDGFSNGKIYPTVGSGLMTIVAIEDVTLENGRVFADCIKVHNQSGHFDNYYWYAKDYGLVKYILGSTDESLAAANTPDGLIIGEYDTSANVF